MTGIKAEMVKAPAARPSG